MKGTVLSGMRPTGKLHLGNYVGALAQWVHLQKDYECFFMVADWHALTTDYAEPGNVQDNIREMVLDWLAAGIDPEKSVVFRQSDLLVHAELQLLLGMITPVSWLERNPTYKEQLEELKEKEISTYGFLGYPVLQAADILIYRATTVPVGEDQLPHLELTREIARRFNHLYGKKGENGKKVPILPEPQAYLSKTPKVPGIDGRKMSKSYNNCLYLTDAPEVIAQKVSRMYTDPLKIRANDPGHPEGCVVYALHQVYNAPDAPRVERECKAGTLTCTADKKHVTQILTDALKPFQERRAELERKKDLVQNVLRDGARRAAQRAEKTMADVRSAMGMA